MCEEHHLAREAETQLRIASVESKEWSRIATAEAAERCLAAEQINNLELRLAQANAVTHGIVLTNKAKMPKLPAFVDSKDELNSYLLQFEHLLLTANGQSQNGPLQLVPYLLAEVYSRLSNTDAVDYAQLKQALLNRYDLNEEEYQIIFQNSQSEKGKSPLQFAVRLKV